MESAGPTVVATSAAMRRVVEEVARVARLHSTVLLVGETGVGKGLVARILHARSPRARRPFVHADCAALAEAVLESELFGHERGAFTGAVTRRVGRFERAADGTLFLDEVGELDASLQGRLLRVLQDREFERVGSSDPLRLRARVVAATQRDLHADARAGRFRADLLYRLDVLRIRVPPLRQRRDDVPALVAARLARCAARDGRAPPRLSRAALGVLVDHTWPGNVRELENAVERLSARFAGERITSDQVESCLDRPAPLGYGDRVRERADARPAEPGEISRALREARGNVAAAARRLGLARTTLRRRMAALGLTSAPARPAPAPAERGSGG